MYTHICPEFPSLSAMVPKCHGGRQVRRSTEKRRWILKKRKQHCCVPQQWGLHHEPCCIWQCDGLSGDAPPFLPITSFVYSLVLAVGDRLAFIDVNFYHWLLPVWRWGKDWDPEQGKLVFQQEMISVCIEFVKSLELLVYLLKADATHQQKIGNQIRGINQYYSVYLCVWGMIDS